MKRFNYFNKLTKWLKSQDRRPLLLRGARQVGKTHLIRSWVKTQTEYHLVEINLEESKSARDIFEKDLDIEIILDELNIITGKNLRAKSSIVFIDEIQAQPKAITALRYFYEKKPEIIIIAAGSLLEFVLEEISFPVGRIETLFVAPFSFEEFLENTTDNDRLIEEYKRFNIKTKTILDTVHNKLSDLVKLYFKVGGMPKAVLTYKTHRDMALVTKEQEIIISSYKNDFIKYAKLKDIGNLNLVFDKISGISGGSRIKFSYFSRELTADKIRALLNLLNSANIISKTICTNSKIPPLATLSKVDLFKVAFLDIGLLQFLMGFDWRELNSEQDLTTLAEGRLAEQFVTQELIANNSQSEKYQTYYWERDKKGADAEIDFLIARNNQIIPIEVKSGTKGKLKSLIQYKTEFSPNTSIVLRSNTLSIDDDTLFFPLYMAGKI